MTFHVCLPALFIRLMLTSALQSINRYLRSSFRLDKRDDTRKHELMLTYIESPMWEEYRAGGVDGFIRNFEDVDDAVIEGDLKKLRYSLNTII